MFCRQMLKIWIEHPSKEKFLKKIKDRWTGNEEGGLEKFDTHRII